VDGVVSGAVRRRRRARRGKALVAAPRRRCQLEDLSISVSNSSPEYLLTVSGDFYICP
jgi:hypothetical protein